MEQLSPELRQVTLPTVTIQNDNATIIQPAITIPHANPSPEQPGHSRTVTIKRRRSLSRSSSSSQKGGGECRPVSRKRNESSPARIGTSAAPRLIVRDSSLSKPPPDKTISNKQTVPQARPVSTIKLTKLKSVVSEASVLPPPPGPQSNKPQ